MAQLQENPRSTNSSRRHSFRWKSVVFVLISGLAGIVAIVEFAPDRTFRVMYLYNFVATWAVIACIWWLGFSGVSRSMRFGTALAAALVATAAIAGSVRRIVFDGAMAPRFEWRWQPSADAEREKWFRQQRQAETDVLADEPHRVTSEDWSRYCGTDGSRTVDEPLSVRNWQQHPPKQLWRHPVGEGWSSFAVVGSRAFTQEQRGPLECVVCYRSDSGVEIWAHTDETRYETAMGGIGPRATPTVTDSAVFALGATGIFNCMDPVTGTILWQRNICEDAESSMPEWGFCGSPLLVDNTVVIDAGGSSNKAVIAYDQSTGDIVWAAENHRAGYSSPRLEIIDGQHILLVFHGDGLLAIDPTDGSRLWQYPFTNMYHVNAAQPLLIGDHVIVSNGYDGGCVALETGRITNGCPAEVWPPNRRLKLKFNEAVVQDGFVYGLDDGILCCIDAASGERRWKGGRYRFGQVLLWDGVLLVQSENGHTALVEATPDAYREITRFPGLSRLRGGGPVKVWNVPVVNRSRLYIRSAEEAACFELPR